MNTLLLSMAYFGSRLWVVCSDSFRPFHHQFSYRNMFLFYPKLNTPHIALSLYILPFSSCLFSNQDIYHELIIEAVLFYKGVADVYTTDSFVFAFAMYFFWHRVLSKTPNPCRTWLWLMMPPLESIWKALICVSDAFVISQIADWRVQSPVCIILPLWRSACVASFIASVIVIIPRPRLCSLWIILKNQYKLFNPMLKNWWLSFGAHTFYLLIRKEKIYSMYEK